MMSDSNAGATAQVGALTNGHTHAQGAGSVSGTGADGGEASSADGDDGGGEAEPPLAADTPGVEGMGSGSPPPYSLAWWRSQNFPPDVPVLQHNGCSDGGLTAHHHEEVNGAKSGRPILSNVGSSADCLHGHAILAAAQAAARDDQKQSIKYSDGSGRALGDDYLGCDWVGGYCPSACCADAG